MKIIKVGVPGSVNNGDVFLGEGECQMLVNYETLIRGRLSIRDISEEYDSMLTLLLDSYFDSIIKPVAVYYGAYLPSDAGSDHFLLIYGVADSEYRLRMLYETDSGLWKWGDEFLTNGEFSSVSGWTEDNADLSVSGGIGTVTANGAAYGGIYQDFDVTEGEVLGLVFQHKIDEETASVCAYKVQQYKVIGGWTDLVATTDLDMASEFGAFVSEELTVGTDVIQLRVQLMIKTDGETGDFRNVMVIRDWLRDLDEVADFSSKSEMRSAIDGNKVFLSDNVNYPFFIEFTKKRECEFGRLGYPAPWSKPVIEVDGYDEDDYDATQEDDYMGEPGLVQCCACYVDENGVKSNPSPVSLSGDMQYFKIWTDEDGSQINRIKQIKVSGLELPTTLASITKERIKYWEISLRVTLYSAGKEAKVLGYTRQYEIGDKDGSSSYLITLPIDYGTPVDYSNQPAPIGGDIAANDGILNVTAGEGEMHFAGFEHDHYIKITLNNENSRVYVDGVVRMRLDGASLFFLWASLLSDLNNVRFFDQDMSTGLPVIYNEVGGSLTDIVNNGDFDNATPGLHWTGWGDPIEAWYDFGYPGWHEHPNSDHIHFAPDGERWTLTNDGVFTAGTTYTVCICVGLYEDGWLEIAIGTNSTIIYAPGGYHEVEIEAAGTDPELSITTDYYIKYLRYVHAYDTSTFSNVLDLWARVPMMESGNVHILYLVWADQRKGYLGTGSFANGKFFDVDADDWAEQKVFELNKVLTSKTDFCINCNEGSGELHNKRNRLINPELGNTTWETDLNARVYDMPSGKYLGENCIETTGAHSGKITIDEFSGNDLPNSGIIYGRIKYNGADLHYNSSTHIGYNEIVGINPDLLGLFIMLSGSGLIAESAQWQTYCADTDGFTAMTPGFAALDYEYFLLISWDKTAEKWSLFTIDQDGVFASEQVDASFLDDTITDIIIGYYFQGTCNYMKTGQWQMIEDIYLNGGVTHDKNAVWCMANFMPFYPNAIIGYEKSTGTHNNNIEFGDVVDRYDLEGRHYNLRPSKKGGMSFPILWERSLPGVIERIIYSRTVLPLQSQNGIAILMRNGLSRFIMSGQPEDWGVTADNLIFEQRRYGLLAKESLVVTPRGIVYLSESGLILWSTEGTQVISNSPGLMYIPLRDDYVGTYIAMKQSYYLHLMCANETATASFGAGDLSFVGNCVSGYDFAGADFEAGMILVITGTKLNNGSYVVDDVGISTIYVYGTFIEESISGSGVSAIGKGYVTYVWDQVSGTFYIHEGLEMESCLELSGGNRIENSNLMLEDGVITLYPLRSNAEFGSLTRIRTARMTVGGERRNAVLRKIRIKGSGTISGSIICYSENYGDGCKAETFELTDERWKTLGTGVIAESFLIEISSGDNISSIEVMLT